MIRQWFTRLLARLDHQMFLDTHRPEADFDRRQMAEREARIHGLVDRERRAGREDWRDAAASDDVRRDRAAREDFARAR